MRFFLVECDTTKNIDIAKEKAIQLWLHTKATRRRGIVLSRVGQRVFGGRHFGQLLAMGLVRLPRCHLALK